MRKPADVIDEIRRRFNRTWASDLTGAAISWPHRFPIGTVTKTEMEAGWQSTYFPLMQEWRRWAREHSIQLHTKQKQVYTTLQDIPTHCEIPNLDIAAQLLGDSYLTQITTGRARFAQLVNWFPQTPSLAPIVRAVDRYTNTDFELLLTVASWFRDNNAIGLTPRQVPLPGIHAKWLNSHQPLILALCGKENLGLIGRHPPRIHFTYLDPAHRTAGGRRHDCATAGDAFSPAYIPEIVLISENKDTAIHFPPLEKAIAVEGEGFGGKTAAGFWWISDAPHLYYWGDIDPHGFEILNGWREDGVPVSSILMDEVAYKTYEPFGTNHDRNGALLKPGNAKPLPLLTAEERRVYCRLVDPQLQTHRRIEQERVPLTEAVNAIRVHMSG